MAPHSCSPGFTLAELLIALAILGVIAAFTIPKVLESQNNAKWNAQAKDAIATFSGAVQAYRVNNQITTTTDFDDILQAGNVNYLKYWDGGALDMRQGEASQNLCPGGSQDCIQLHTGAIITQVQADLGGTASTSAWMFYYDPEPGYSGTTTTGKSIQFFVYANGLVRTRGTTLPNTVASGFAYAAPNPALDPPWFSWSP